MKSKESKNAGGDVIELCVAQVIEKAEFLRREWATTEERTLVEFGNVIGIVGERGSGKTTVLNNVVKKLDRGAHVVVGPITPVDLRASASLLGVVLAELHVAMKELKESVSGSEFGEEFEELDEKLLEAGLDHGRSSEKFLCSLEESGVRGDEFSWQYAEALRSRCVLMRTLGELIEKCLELKMKVKGGSEAGTGNPMLILALDDCDSCPDLLTNIFDDLQCICGCRGVCVVLAYSMDAMLRAAGNKIISAYRETFGEMRQANISDTDCLTQEISEYMQKLSPRSLRVELPSYEDLRKRLLFEPLGIEGKPLYRIFESLRFDEKAPVASFREYFDLSGFFVSGEDAKVKVLPSPYAVILPKSARGLFYLYESLKFFSESRSKPEGVLNPNEILNVLRILTEFAKENLPYGEKRDIDRWITWDERSGFGLDFRELKFGKGGGRSRVIYNVDMMTFRGAEEGEGGTGSVAGGENGQLQLAMGSGGEERKHSVRIRVARHDRFDANRIIKTERGGEVGLRANCGMLMVFLYEFSDESFGLYHGHFGKAPSPGGLNWNHTHEYLIDSEDSDYVGLIVPDYDRHLPYFLYTWAWNKVVDELLAGVGVNVELRNPSLLDFFGLYHLDLVLSIQLNEVLTRRSLPEQFGDQENVEEKIASLKKDIINKCEKLLKKSEAHRKFMEVDGFKRYFAATCAHLLPCFACSDKMADWVKEYILRGFRSEINVEKSLFKAFASYMEGLAGKSWSAEVMIAFGEAMRELDEKVFEDFRGEYYRRWRATRSVFRPETEQLLTALVHQKILTTQDVLSLGKEGFKEAIRAKLVLAKVPDEIISLIRKSFPARSVEGEQLGIDNGLIRKSFPAKEVEEKQLGGADDTQRQEKRS